MKIETVVELEEIINLMCKYQIDFVELPNGIKISKSRHIMPEIKQNLPPNNDEDLFWSVEG